MKLHNTFITLPFLATNIFAFNEQEKVLCGGDCARAMDLAISTNGGASATIKSVKTKSGKGRGGKTKTQKFLLTTKSGSNRIFSTIAAAVPIDPLQLDAFDSDSDENIIQQGRFGLKLKLNVINNYGCWCYGGASWPGARDVTGLGPAMDEYDEACKAHHMGFDCINLDAEAEGETCQPNEEQYSLLMTPQANGDYTLECADSIEDDWCKRRTCMVDLRFLARYWKLEIDNIQKDFTNFGHAGFHNNAGNFDTSVCIVKGPGGGSKGGNNLPIKKVCCGDYPYRIWYDKNNNRGLQCCAYEDQGVSEDYGFAVKIGKLYHTASATCCDSGIVTGSNICP